MTPDLIKIIGYDNPRPLNPWQPKGPFPGPIVVSKRDVPENQPEINSKRSTGGKVLHVRCTPYPDCVYERDGWPSQMWKKEDSRHRREASFADFHDGVGHSEPDRIRYPMDETQGPKGPWGPIVVSKRNVVKNQRVVSDIEAFKKRSTRSTLSKSPESEFQNTDINVDSFPLEKIFRRSFADKVRRCVPYPDCVYEQGGWLGKKWISTDRRKRDAPPGNFPSAHRFDLGTLDLTRLIGDRYPDSWNPILGPGGPIVVSKRSAHVPEVQKVNS